MKALDREAVNVQDADAEGQALGVYEGTGCTFAAQSLGTVDICLCRNGGMRPMGRPSKRGMARHGANFNHGLDMTLPCNSLALLLGGDTL